MTENLFARKTDVDSLNGLIVVTGNYTQVNGPDGSRAVNFGSIADPENYYYAASHRFKDRLAVDVATINVNGISTAGVLATSSSAGLGYAVGAGGSVTQATSKSTGVTINKVSGQITLNSAALASNTSVGFVVTNSAVAATDVVIVNLVSGFATDTTYMVFAERTSAGHFQIHLRNVSGGSLSEAVIIQFNVIKGVIT